MQPPFRRRRTLHPGSTWSWMAVLAAALWALSPSASLHAADDDAPLVVEHGTDVSIEYTLSTKQDGVVNSNVGGEPFTYTQGSTSLDCMVGLQKHLAGLQKGDKLSLVLPSNEGCGPIDPNAIIEIEIEMLPPEARHVGKVVQSPGPHGITLRAKVKEIKDGMIVLDLNHPLAGKTLYFDITILDITKSSPQPHRQPAPPDIYRQ